MKKLTITLIVILIASFSMVGCKSTIDEGEMVDSIVIDENTKETVDGNSTFKVSMIAKTELVGKSILEGENCFMNGKGKIIRYTGKFNGSESILEEFEVGSITEKKDENFNSIDWEQKDVKGKYFRDGINTVSNSSLVMISNDDKVYSVDSFGDLKELTPKALVENINDGFKLIGISFSEDKSAIVYSLVSGETRKLYIVNNKNGDYYEIVGETLSDLSRGKIKVLGIENNKIYMALYNNSDFSVTVGYFENDKFNDIVTFSEKNDIKIQITGNIIYSNNRLLFLGLVEDKRGIYNYDISSKKLLPELMTESVNEDYNYLDINITKDKLIIMGTDKTDVFKQSINIATIDKKLDLSNIINVAKTDEQGDYRLFEGWGDSGEEFYLRHMILSKNEEGIFTNDVSVYFEVYKINN